MDNRRRQWHVTEHCARGAASNRRVATGHIDDPNATIDQSFEPMLGQNDREPALAVQAYKRVEDFLGGEGVELRSRFIEHEHAWTQSKRRGDGDTLFLATR